jgi:organic hydroperoxide reductase OsmC/OhrA
MQPFPHRYSATAAAAPEGEVALDSPKLSRIASAPPAEFDGPGDRWSPETLLVAAVADCFTLNFRAIARASKFAWISLECSVEGTVDRIDRVTQFTRLDVRARLRVPAGTREDQAVRLLQKAEETCLVSNSLKVEPHFETVVEIEGGS